MDVGTGTGYFAALLAAMGHEVTGIDLTPAMIDEAKSFARDLGVSAHFEVMDAQALQYPDESFDAVVTRNLTWTLPEPERAYSEWLRVLRRGGIHRHNSSSPEKKVWVTVSHYTPRARVCVCGEGRFAEVSPGRGGVRFFCEKNCKTRCGTVK